MNSIIRGKVERVLFGPTANGHPLLINRYVVSDTVPSTLSHFFDVNVYVQAVGVMHMHAENVAIAENVDSLNDEHC